MGYRLASFNDISIHALREEGDVGRFLLSRAQRNFYPRPPRGGRPDQVRRRRNNDPISIHALREEGDRSPVFRFLRSANISIHALREEGDPREKQKVSTSVNFYPRPPRGGRLKTEATNYSCARFLSTPSARRATANALALQEMQKISIHALREEGDLSEKHPSTHSLYFYPRPPRGGRRVRLPRGVGGLQFLSTPSARRATIARTLAVENKVFLSTPSARRATIHSAWTQRRLSISIHALREEGDSKNGESIPAFDQSINQAAQNGKSCERKTFLKLEICAERQAFPGAKVPGI